MPKFTMLCGTAALAGCLVTGSLAWGEEQAAMPFDSGLAIGGGLAALQTTDGQAQSGRQLLANWREGSGALGPVSLQELMAVANGERQLYRVNAEGAVEKVRLSELMADARWRKRVSQRLWRSQD